ncbi:MAG TPA: response regulator transcription factor, partial [Verrucomicrobiae bacterium]|nr:response regulator transcription factor [Verrucomicrobiae bacterium]
MPIQVLLADDHPIVREGVKTLLEREGIDVVGEASDGREAVRLAQTLRPNVAVLDLSMPLLNGLLAGQEILHVSPRTKPILLTMHVEDHYVLHALR